MSPSQIVKSACPAGCSLKAFARQVVNGPSPVIVSSETARACKAWLANKTQQRKQASACARKARRGHNVVHTQQQARSAEHCTGCGPGIMREGGRP